MKNIKEKIKEDLKAALKGKKETEVSTLRMLLASILNKEKKKRYSLAKNAPELGAKKLEEKSQLEDQEIVEVVFSEVKKRKEAALQFEKGQRKDLAEKEKKEIEILKKYLPELLSEEEIKKEAVAIIEKIGAKGLKDMGKVMGALMQKLKGKAEGGQVSKIVRELLSKNV